MEFANDIQIGTFGAGPGPAAHAAPRLVPEWSGLYARLSAAHALRREMERSEPASAVCGSFSDWPIEGRRKTAGKRDVNLKDSVDRKGPWPNAIDMAGPFDAGDREQR